MKKKLLLILLCLPFIGFGQGGCNVPHAINYNPNANYNNGTCQFAPVVACDVATIYYYENWIGMGTYVNGTALNFTQSGTYESGWWTDYGMCGAHLQLIKHPAVY